MYYEVKSAKVLAELVKLAEKSGWDTEYVNEYFEGVVLYGDEGAIQTMAKVDVYEGEVFSSLKSVKRVLSRPVLNLESGYVVVKLNKGIQVGCTVLSQTDCVAITKKLKEKDIYVNGKEVLVRNGYVNLGESDSMTVEDALRIAKFAGIKV